MVNEQNKSLEMILVKMGLLNEEGLLKAVEAKKASPQKTLSTILLERSIISEFDYIRAMGVKYNLPLVNLAAQKISPAILRYISEEDAKKNVIIPVHETEYLLHVATDNPFKQVLFEKLSQLCGKQVSVLLATQNDIEEAIRQNYIQQSVNNIMAQIEEEFGKGEEAEEEIFTFDDDNLQNDSIVKAVGVILEQGYQRKASDIHIEPIENYVTVRLRIDGELIETMSFAKTAFGHLLSRFKVLGGLDIAEKRLPQDGRMNVLLDGEKVNMRISTLPTIFGEKIVIRILGTSNPKDILGIEDLHMGLNQPKFEKGLNAPNGIVLITGPTGSGKTTTVYAALKMLAKSTINVITVEDPVEKILPNINQVQVNTKSGLTFATGLRSILRQDPDIVMIGEIRDAETAEIGARAAITGHLVIATMHTNDAASAFMRLIDMGVEPYMVASSIVCVVAQRLVKKICKYCKEEYTPEQEELVEWEGELPERLHHGRGCPMCNNTGYLGRMAVYEIVEMDNKVKRFVVQKAESYVIKEYLKEEKGFLDLGLHMQELVKQGITTTQELKKIKTSLD